MQASITGENLAWFLTPQELGFVPGGIWNSSPSVENMTGFYDVPRTITLGTTFDVPSSASRFSPPPFAVVVRDGTGSRRVLLVVHAARGHHNFATVTFDASVSGVTVTVELEGHTSPETERPYVSLLRLEASSRTESELELLARGLAAVYPEASRRKVQYDWWRLPIFCAGGAGCAMAFHLFGPGAEARCMPFASEWMVQRNLDILDAAEVPVGSVIIDCGWSPGGVWKPYAAQWADMKGFIARQHAAGRRVLLWLGMWFTEGIRDDWCIHAPAGTCYQSWDALLEKQEEHTAARPLPLWTDAGNPDYLAFTAGQVIDLISPDGLDADGFKIDMLQMTPCERFAQGREHWNRPLMSLENPHGKSASSGSKWGCELLYDLQKTIHDAAKSVKPDALINSSTVHPYFADTFDMMRLHDTCRIEADTDVFEVMASRARLAKAALPSHAVDADNWIHTYYDKWMDYTLNSYKLGTPCLFFTEYFVRSFTERPAAQPISFEDLRRLGRRWCEVLGLKKG